MPADGANGKPFRQFFQAEQASQCTSVRLGGCFLLEGHFDREKPSAGQLRALDSLVLFLASKYRIKAQAITGHNDHARSDCPGRNLKRYLAVLRDKVETALGPH